jgi:hypothetical protein
MIIQYKVGSFPLKVGKWYSRPDFAVSNARWLCIRAVEKAKNEQKQSTAN